MTIKLRTQIKHPARVESGPGVAVAKDNGVITVGLDLAALSQTPLVADESTATLLLITPGDPPVVERITVEDFASGLNIPDTSGLPGGYIGERRVEINGVDTDHDVDFYPFFARNTTNTVDIAASTTITKRIDANWSAGSGGGGLDTGTVANNTWYYCHRIRRSDTGNIDALFSLSSTAPTLPANYDSFQLQGAVLTNGSANLVDMSYESGTYYLAVSALDHNATGGTALGAIPTNYALRVPRIRGVTAIFSAYGFKAGTAFAAWIIVPGFRAADIANAGYTIVQQVAGLGSGTRLEMQVDGSGQVTAVAPGGASDFQLRTLGWRF